MSRTTPPRPFKAGDVVVATNPGRLCFRVSKVRADLLRAPWGNWYYASSFVLAPPDAVPAERPIVASKKMRLSGRNIPNAQRHTEACLLRLPPEVARLLPTRSAALGLSRSAYVARLIRAEAEAGAGVEPADRDL